MDDWQKMSLYSQSRLEQLKSEAATARMLGQKRSPFVRLLVFFTAILLGMALWWVR